MKRFIIEYLVLSIIVGGTAFIGTNIITKKLDESKNESSNAHILLNTNLSKSNTIGEERNEILSDIKTILENYKCKNDLANIENSINTIADQLYIDLNN